MTRPPFAHPGPGPSSAFYHQHAPYVYHPHPQDPRHYSHHLPPQYHHYYPPQHLNYSYPYPAYPTPPTWSNQSPLPKQLSMPPPDEQEQVYHEQHEDQAIQQPAPSPPSPQATNTLVPTPPPPETTPPPLPIMPPAESNQIYAVWSSRPNNPASAPGLIISRRARPPPDVVSKAIVTKTPPRSPVVKPVEIDSSAATLTPLMTPASPVSTSTSLSQSLSPKLVAPVPEAKSSSPEATPVVQEVEPSALQAESSTQATTPTPAPPPPAPATPPVKKSWASLLRPASSPVSSPAPAGQSKLPTSSVVGFSIPAEPTPSVSQTKKAVIASLLDTSSPLPTTSKARIRPRGLVNQGNMCYANSVLQVLVYCQPFQALFSELGKVMTDTVQSRKIDWEAPLVQATVDFLDEFVKQKPVKKENGKGKEKAEEDWDNDWDSSFMPTNVYDAMKEKKRFDNMGGGQQEDAEEFFGFYLDTLEEELLKLAGPSNTKQTVQEEESEEQPEGDGWMEVGKRNRTVVTRMMKNTESPITRMFGGKFRSTLKAPGQKDSAIVEDWRSLRLDIQPEHIEDVKDALAYISHAQTVTVTHPARPGVSVEASQQVLIESLPPILVLHLKRFCYDTNVRGVVKVGKFVRFGPELTIPSQLMTPSNRKTPPPTYKLFGVLYHHGISAEGGHYTLDVLHSNRFAEAPKSKEGWVRIDDELVSDVRPEDVFGIAEKDDSRCAYLLFYRRM